ncbi:MAG TPA: universal stress protein [Usitatibacter sp.]|nr:universal stress protein [Usitatibacter sp.]
MYKHILLPTDGSALSEEAARAGIELARRIGATVTALHVLPEPNVLGIDGWTHGDEDYARHLAKALERHGELYVEAIRDEARRAGVQCDAALARGDSPEDEIIAQAQARGCDLIVMASHGRKGSDGVLLASVTLGVATLGHIPVLIHHGARTRPAAGAGTRKQPAESGT